MKKKLIAFLAALFLFAALAVPSYAVQESKLIQWVQADQGRLSILLSTQTAKVDYAVTIDGQPVPVSVQSIQSQALPVTVYCLVDTSGTINNYRTKLIQGTLTQISQSLSENDNMIITTVGETVQESAALETEQERADAIAAIEFSSKAADLYTSISDGITRLASATDMNPVRALVILSSGLNRNNSGVTDLEVRDAIEKTRVPVFSVAVVVNTAEKEGGRILGTFARSSCGGTYQTTASGNNAEIRWDATGQEFGAGVWKTISSYRVLTADLSQLELSTSGSEAKLTVSYTQDNSSFTDSVLIPTTGLIAPTVPEETVDPEPMEAETAAEATEEEKAPASAEAETEGETEIEPELTETEPETMLKRLQLDEVPLSAWIAAGVVLLAVIILIPALAAKKKKAKKLEQEAAKRAKDEQDELNRLKEEEERLAEARRREMRDTVSQPVPGCYVTMVDIPHGKSPKRFVVPIGEAVSFGRDTRAKYVLDGNDSQLSGLHFSLIIQSQSSIRVRDEHSTNGTYINGVQISQNGWSKMENGDKLRAGSREYRVTVSTQGNI